MLILPFWGNPRTDCLCDRGIPALFLSRSGNPQVGFSNVARIQRKSDCTVQGFVHGYFRLYIIVCPDLRKGG